MRRFIAVACVVTTSACSVIGIRSGTEEPRYDVVDHIGDVEIRQYAPRIAATTRVLADEEQARSEGFRILASYIFGHNKSSESIAMTAPVAQSAETSPGQRVAMTAPVEETRAGAGAWMIAFYAPASLTLKTMPEPADPRVEIVAVPAEAYAVLRFSGDRSGAAVEARLGELRQAVAASKWRPTGAAVAWFYDPPWTIPLLRRNEVAIPVKR